MKCTSFLAKKAGLLLPSLVALLAGGAVVAHGQSALDGFDPNANGAIRIVVVQPDGKILIAGDFTALAPNGGTAVTRNYLARLNPDGTLDTNFNANANGGVLSIAVDSDGKILVGGNFANIGGQPRNRLARLDPITGAADSFDPNPNADVYAIAVQGDGKILVGGVFNGVNSIGGQARNNIARLDANTGLADSFDPNAQGIVQSITLQPYGKILVGGQFAFIGGQPRNYLARLDPATGLADSFDPQANGLVRSIAFQADGKIVVGGNFSFIGGQARNFIARLDAGTGSADAFNPNANNQVYKIAIQPDGKILAGGFFSGANSIGGQARNYLARLDPLTGLADSFDPNASGGVVFAVAVQLDGKVVAGGNFTSLSPDGGTAVTRNNIARLERDGRLDRTLDLNIVGSVVGAIAVQPDGKLLIGGQFTSVLGVARTNIARLHTDGTLDTVFNPNANGPVDSIVVLEDGRILVGGGFSGPNSIGGAERNYIARLDGVTGAADSFDPKIDGGVFSMVTQGDGKILVCGAFNNIGGLARNYLARLNSDGTLDAAFNPDPNSAVGTIAFQDDGKILAGGDFISIGGQPRNHIARLDPVTGLADSFDPNAGNIVSSIVVAFRRDDAGVFVGGSFTNIGGLGKSHFAVLRPDGSVKSDFPGADDSVVTIAPQGDFGALMGGEFSHIGDQPRNRIGRFNFEFNTGTNEADAFDPNASGEVSSLALQSDGKILAGGFFSGANSIGGQARNYFARLNNSILAYQKVDVYSEFIRWAEYGGTPQFSRVTFEFSTNNVNYNFLGNGVEDALSNWQLPPSSGRFFNFPIEQNFYIRARGYYSSGYLNGSESIEESVRIAYFLPLPHLNIQLSGNTNVVLSWDRTTAEYFILETSTNLNANVWSDVAGGSVIGINIVVTDAISGPARFYRLRRSY